MQQSREKIFLPSKWMGNPKSDGMNSSVTVAPADDFRPRFQELYSEPKRMTENKASS